MRNRLEVHLDCCCCLPIHHDAIINDDPPDVHPVLLESLDADVIRSAALHTSGAAGTSGLDALCHSLALTAKHFCTELVDPATIAPLMAIRLIALDKNPGVRCLQFLSTDKQLYITFKNSAPSSLRLSLISTGRPLSCM